MRVFTYRKKVNTSKLKEENYIRHLNSYIKSREDKVRANGYMVESKETSRYINGQEMLSVKIIGHKVDIIKKIGKYTICKLKKWENGGYYKKYKEGYIIICPNGTNKPFHTLLEAETFISKQ